MTEDKGTSAKPHHSTTVLAVAALIVSIVGAVTSITIAVIAKHQAQTAREALTINQRALAQKLSVSTDLFSLTIANAGTLPFRSVSIYFKDYDGKPVTQYYLVGDLAGCTSVKLDIGSTLPHHLIVAFTDANGMKWQEDPVHSTAAPSKIPAFLPTDYRDWPEKTAKVAQCS